MTDHLKIALAQLNPTVGDISGNMEKIRNAYNTASDGGADLMVTGELVTSGYPPEDLVLKPIFMDRIEASVRSIATETKGDKPAIVISTPWRKDGLLYNAILLLDEGEVKAFRPKCELPNYGVFDEKRIFTAGEPMGPVGFKGVALGLLTCEDLWYDHVVECLEETGAEILLSPNGSPFEMDKLDARMNHAVARVKESNLPLVYVNQVGGQDELLFDGASFILNKDCSLAVQMSGFSETVLLTDWVRGDDGWSCKTEDLHAPAERLDAVYQAMVLGLRDYVQKNGFPGVVLGMSGGIDSALSAAVAVDALGPERVHCVMMPSPYTSVESLEDAEEAVSMLGVKLDEVSIGPAMTAFENMLSPLFEGTKADTTEENVQSRSRGLILMAISNKLGSMVLTTGNKSEMSVGYATLYGDMCGGYSVLKDIYKMDVFALCKLRNLGKIKDSSMDLLGPDGPVMPERIISKPPSAELKPDQKDEDSLPPYEILDDILYCMVEGEMSVDDIVERGHDLAVVQRIWRLLDLAEYKRRQAPPGVKVTSRAFGRDRRYPITNAFRRAI